MANTADDVRDAAAHTDCDTGDASYAYLLRLADTLDSLRKADRGCGKGLTYNCFGCDDTCGMIITRNTRRRCPSCQRAREEAIRLLTTESTMQNESMPTAPAGRPAGRDYMAAYDRLRAENESLLMRLADANAKIARSRELVNALRRGENV